MILFRLPNRPLRAGVTALLVMAAALLYPVGGNLSTRSASAAPLLAVPAVSVTVPAGGSVSLQVQGFALEPGSALPQNALILAQQPIPSDILRTTLYYGVDWGYAQTNPRQVALALWYIRNGIWPSEDHTIAERIVSAATASPGTPAWSANGRSITGLVAQNQLVLSELNLTPGTQSSAAGSGTLTLRNNGPQDAQVYLPYGTLFTSATGSALVWATGQGQPPVEASATAAPPAPTDTPQPIPTTPASTKPGYPPPANTSVPPPPPKGGEASPTAVPATATQAPVNEPPIVEPPTNEDTTGSTKPDPDDPSNGASESKTDTGNTGSDGAQTAAPVEQQPEAFVSEPVSEQPDDIAADSLEAPPLPVNNQSDSGASAPPLPPSQATTSPVPGPVGTSEPNAAQATPPSAILTQQATIPAGGGPGTATPTTATKQEPTAEVKPTEPTKIEVQPQPTPEPTKIPEPPVGGGVIDPIISPNPEPIPEPVIPGATPGGLADTGGGPSNTPVWLAVLSAIMVLGGWSLRRISSTPPEIATVQSESSE